MEINIGTHTEAEMHTWMSEIAEGKTLSEISQRREKQTREYYTYLWY